MRLVALLALAYLFAAPPEAAQIELARSRAPLATAAEVGIASWYGGDHEGRLTASGERFRGAAMTAAHTGWRFGSIVRVTSLQTGRSVVVRINDRGPFIHRRSIDLSRGAAELIFDLRDGLEPVLMERVK